MIPKRTYRIHLSQRSRVVMFLIYIVVLVIANAALFSTIIPSDLWFWAAFLSLLLGTFITEPHFTAPKDALSNVVAAFGTSIGVLVLDSSLQVDQGLWIAYLITVGIVGIVAVASMLMGRAQRLQTQRYAEALKRLSVILGSSRFLFTGIFVLSVRSFHTDFNEIFWLMLVWIVVVLGKPVEEIWHYYNRVAELFRSRANRLHDLGQLISRKEPGIITVRLFGDTFPEVGTLVMTATDEQSCQLGLVTDNYQLAEDRWTQALIFAKEVPRSDIDNVWIPEGIVARCPKELIKGEWLKQDIYQHQDKLLGVVAQRSDISLIRIELLRDDLALSEGQLLTVPINDEQVLYQIVNGLTQTELLEQANQHGFLEIEARKLGKWNDKEHKLESVAWVPQMFSPAYTRQEESSKFHANYIGHIPRTKYGLSVDCNQLVTHNTAILGVLGTGKTTLAFELISRMISDGIKVWVIDITGQYKEHFDARTNPTKQKIADDEIRTVIEADVEKVDDNQGTGGNHPAFRQAVRSHISKFVEDGSWRLRIFDPDEFDVTEQSRGAYNREAAFSRLTPAQITRIVTEELLKNVKSEPSDEKRVCVVFEEAHSLVPEWNAVAAEQDKSATNATAKAILQGRKYGLGCLLITQRTAHVTKSILNQCNTVFALQTFDKTGMEFLSNYIGDDYTSLLSTLPPHHCVAYGRALNTQTPVMIEVNKKKDFSKNFQWPEEYVEPDEESQGRSDDIAFVGDEADDYHDFDEPDEPDYDFPPDEDDGFARPPEDPEDIPF